MAKVVFGNRVTISRRISYCPEMELERESAALTQVTIFPNLSMEEQVSLNECRFAHRRSSSNGGRVSKYGVVTMIR
jgi:hypothetical protein